MGVFANVMIPTLAGHVFAMVLLLIPVALIEATVLAVRHKLAYDHALRLITRANWRSTFYGLPLGYCFALAGLIPAGMFAMFLPENGKSLVTAAIMNTVGFGGIAHPPPREWNVLGFYVGTLLVMIPYFFVTVYVEYTLLIESCADLHRKRLAVSVFLMNGITYFLLALPVLAGTYYAFLNAIVMASLSPDGFVD